MHTLRMLIRSGTLVKLGWYVLNHLDELVPVLREGVDLLDMVQKAQADDGKIDVSEAATITPEARRVLDALVAVLERSQKAQQ